MSRFPLRHARLLRQQQLRRTWLSLALCLALLSAGGGALALFAAYGAAELGRAFSFTGIAGVQPQPQQPPPPTPHAPLPPLPPPSEAVVTISLPMAPLPPPTPAEAEELPLPTPADELLLPLPDESAKPPPPPAPPARRRPAAIAATPPSAPGGPAAPAYTPPAYLHTPKPPYPPAMRQSRLEGTVRLRIALDAEGHPRQVDIITGSGHTDFDTTARLWVLKHWRFSPARRGAQPIPGSVITSVHFVLN